MIRHREVCAARAWVVLWQLHARVAPLGHPKSWGNVTSLASSLLAQPPEPLGFHGTGSEIIHLDQSVVWLNLVPQPNLSFWPIKQAPERHLPRRIPAVETRPQANATLLAHTQTLQKHKTGSRRRLLGRSVNVSFSRPRHSAGVLILHTGPTRCRHLGKLDNYVQS
jgi:hypothetical protein